MNRRKTTRRGMKTLPIEVARVGFLSLFEKGPRQSGYAADISETGVRVLLKQPLTRWEEVFVILSRGTEPTIRAKGRVAWCVPASREKKVFSVGIELKKLGGSVRAAIASMIEQQQLDEGLRKYQARRGGPSAN